MEGSPSGPAWRPWQGPSVISALTSCENPPPAPASRSSSPLLASSGRLSGQLRPHNPQPSPRTALRVEPHISFGPVVAGLSRTRSPVAAVVAPAQRMEALLAASSV